MRTATVYVTIDGRQFNDAAKAKQYEDGLHAAWLKDNPSWRDFLDAADSREAQAKRAEVVREFWEWNFSK